MEAAIYIDSRRLRLKGEGWPALLWALNEIEVVPRKDWYIADCAVSKVGKRSGNEVHSALPCQGREVRRKRRLRREYHHMADPREFLLDARVEAGECARDRAPYFGNLRRVNHIDELGLGRRGMVLELLGLWEAQPRRRTIGGCRGDGGAAYAYQGCLGR